MDFHIFLCLCLPKIFGRIGRNPRTDLLLEGRNLSIVKDSPNPLSFCCSFLLVTYLPGKRKVVSFLKKRKVVSILEEEKLLLFSILFL